MRASLIGGVCLLLAACVGSGPATRRRPDKPVVLTQKGDEPAVPDISSDGPTLREAAKSSGKLIGAAVNHFVMPHKAGYRQVLAREFDYVTPENCMKWGFTEPRPGDFRFADGDALVTFAAGHGMKVKGHALLWHQSLPAWVGKLDAAGLRAAIERHIDGVAGHFKGQLVAWDVVNEAFEDNGEFRQSPFWKALGEGYIADAFRRAHAADPGALLFYNDYNSEGFGPKSDAVYELARKLLDQKVPIAGVGLQMHITARGGVDARDVARNMERLAALGLLVNISEMDVRIGKLSGPLEARLQAQRQVYRDMVAACVAQPRCHGVTLWGFTDAHSWVDGFFGPDDPLPFDEAYRRKPAFYGVREALLGR